ncbi:MAG: RAMP superfamily protein [Bryobacteraceae bacterium]
MSAKTPSFLRVELLSDASFSCGEPSPGVVDIEIEHDEMGLPFIGGRTLRGLLRDSWLSMHSCFPGLEDAAARVLGRCRALDESCRLRIGNALPPGPLRQAVRAALERQIHPLSPGAILRALTAIRYQTAEDRETGAPAETTLRSSRVALRGLYFDALLEWLDGYSPTREDLRVLALCALATRHGGLMRNRGRGHIRVTLDGNLGMTRKLAEARS